MTAAKISPAIEPRPPTLPNRWRVAAAAAVVMLLLGTLYSWAIFTQPLLVAYHWDMTVATGAFSLANFCLAAVGAIVGGFWQDHAGPRRVALVGVVLWGTGNLLAGLGTPDFGILWLCGTYGVMGGLGAGMAYVTPLAMVVKWFPDRKGLVGGLVVGSFGLGAILYNQIVPRMAAFHTASAHASGYLLASSASKAGGEPFDLASLAPSQTFSAIDAAAVMQVFVASGIVFLLVGITAAMQFRNPPTSHMTDRRPAEGAARRSAGHAPAQVIRMPQFYSLWLQLFVSVISGITIISNAVSILVDLTNLSPGDIAPLFGLLSVFNALGRVLWGAASDRIGCSNTFAALFVVQAASVYLLSGAHSLALALVCISSVLLCCGGAFGTMPSFNADYFGTRFMGRNYGMILSAWGCAGLAGPLLAAHAKDSSGSFSGVLHLISGLLAASIILPFITKRPAPHPVEPCSRTHRPAAPSETGT